MNLFNSTPVPAKVIVNPNPGSGDLGIGVLMAKATFRFDTSGRVELDTQTPFPLFDADQKNPLGFLPADRLMSRGDKFEVMLLGHAYPRERRAVPSMNVALCVGKVRREIAVFGDRAWSGRASGKQTIVGPIPFERMPITYDRAYGGSWPVRLDKDTVIDLFDPVNKRGRGFDAELWARGMAEVLGAPPGYPILVDYQRRLPNLENPRELISRWEDAPEPVGWAPAYPDIAVNQLHTIRRETARVAELKRRNRVDPDQVRQDAEDDPVSDPDTGHYRAHSDLVIDMPPLDAVVRLENLLPDAPAIEFSLPRLRLIADYVIYGRQGERALRPYELVLLPEEKAFYLVYGMSFTFERGPATERAFRLRTALGWFETGVG